MTDATEPLQVLYNIFPAKIVYQDGFTLVKARAILTEGELYIIRDNPTGPGVVEDPPLIVTSLAGSGPNTGLQVLTEDGQTLMVSKYQGCGCGSRVKYHQALAGRQLVMVPRG